MTSILSQHYSSTKQATIEDLTIPDKNKLTLTTNAPSRTRLILPSIASRQRTSSSLKSNVTTTVLDNETNNRFTLPSRQNTFMKSISEIS